VRTSGRVFQTLLGRSEDGIGPSPIKIRRTHERSPSPGLLPHSAGRDRLERPVRHSATATSMQPFPSSDRCGPASIRFKRRRRSVAYT
jgi:hypothetical protein